jgi:hypothetical protein
LPIARARLNEVDRFELASPLGEAQLPYVTEDNLSAILIYQAPKGGWHADLLLKGSRHKAESGFTLSRTDRERYAAAGSCWRMWRSGLKPSGSMLASASQR